MKITALPTNRTRQMSGFTLIEMIGVLAVIAILAALLLPKVFNAISDAKINSAVVGAETIKTATADHYGKYGKFETVYGTNILSVGTAYPAYDANVLMVEGLIDKPFSAKIGTNWTVQLRPCAAIGTATDGVNAAYSLEGSGTNSALGQYVVEAVIQGVPEIDAQGVSQRLDGTAFSTSALSSHDYLGRVKYGAVDAAGQTAVYIYLTHR